MTHPDHSPDPGGDATDRLLAEAGFVRRLARSLVRDAALADDVAQETLAAGLAQPGAPRSWRDWLATVTRRQASKARAARLVREAHEAAAARERASHGGREAHAVAGGAGAAAGGTAQRLELQQQLTAAVAALAEPYRTVVTLRYFDGLTPRAIAKRSGATAAAVRQQLHRGLAMLRLRLDRECGGRQRWLGAFAAAGLGGVTVSLVPFAVLAMNKLALAVAAVLVAGGVVWMVADPLSSALPVAPQLADDRSQPVADSSTNPPSSSNEQLQRLGVAPAEARCMVTVRDAAGQPMLDAEVKFWQTDGSVLDVRTDERGQASAPNSKVVGALVRAPDHVPAWQSLTDARSRVELRLAAAMVAGGTLLVDEQPAPSGTRLKFDVTGKHMVEGVPPELEEQLAFVGPQQLECGDAGSFMIGGLPTGAELRLNLPRYLLPIPYTEDGQLRRLTLGRTDHVIHTTRLPTIEGQVVWDDDGTPVAGAHLMVYARFDDGSNTPSTGTGADEHGRFVIGLLTSHHNRIPSWVDPAQRPAVLHVEVQAEFDGCDGATVLEVDRERYSAGPVTLRLRRAPVRHFVAIDVDGAPIEGAVVQTHDPSAPSNAQGQGTFRGDLDDVKLVGAPQHRIGPLAPHTAAAGTIDDPFVFVLALDNDVRISVTDDRGAIPDVHSVVVHAMPPPFAGRRSAAPLDEQLHDFRGWASQVTRWSGKKVEAQVRYHCGLDLPADGSALRLRSLEPGAELQVDVIDRLGSVITHGNVTAPPFGQHAELTLRVAASSHYLEGVVHDELGAPLANADIELRARDAAGEWLSRPDGFTPWLHARSDTQGRFRFGPLHAGLPCRLRATAPGHAPAQRELPADQLWQPQELQLAKGHTVTVRVVDDTDADVPLIAFIRDSDFDNQQVGPSTTRFVDLPPGPMQFSVQVGAVYLSTTHDTRSPDAVLRVPRLGQLVVQCNNGWPTMPEGHYGEARVQRLDAEESAFTIWNPERPGAPPELLLPGRYRVELIEVGDGRRPLGLTAEVTLTAGETATATLR
ncbi:MAG: sigma-70 family RNA polymerase sigma factor [Planctomycetota bacterium]